MATDERNFRSAYYEKVGCRSVEEKKSVEILLKDKLLDRGKLKQFCLRYNVPSAYRNLVWKLMLEVLPMHVDCHAFVMEQRRQEYSDLVHALEVMKVVDSNTPKSQVFLAVWLLQSGNLRLETNFNCNKSFVRIVQALMQFFSDDTDIYWLARNFHELIKKWENDFPKLISICYSILEKEENVLYKHLQKIGALENLPLEDWFNCCFSGILNNELDLGKIWEKLFGGSCKILVYVVIVLLTNLKHRLLKCTDLQTVLQCIKSIPEDTVDVIVNKSIEMWQQHGSPLTIYDKPKP